MMSTATLTSLAILKVNLDQGKDYLEYLRPFILQVLVDHHPDPITNEVISDLIREQFGLEIPKRTVEIVLKRISRNNIIKRENRVYRITRRLPDPKITAKMSEARRHIDAVVFGLQQFSQNGVKPISSYEEAVIAICAFLAEFDVTCLRAYLRGTAIPRLEGTHKADIVLVSEYVQHLQVTSPERFQSLLILVQGNMLANALLCPDLHNAPKSYQKMKFYFDTPLLVRALGLDGESIQFASHELIALLAKLGGKVMVFSHSCQELRNVLLRAADNLNSPNGRGQIIYEARKRGTTKSDLLLLAESIDEKLSEFGIEVEESPRYKEALQVDETAFEQVLEDEVSYNNPRAKECDINSVRSIYAIRGDKSAPSLEKSRAVFVTSNAAFARAAWEYGKKYESSQDVSVVITDFSLANMAWLKAPMGAPGIPRTQLLAFAYAALKPTSKLLEKLLTEIDKLKGQGKITEHAHQLLRSSPKVYSDLMHFTLGEHAALTDEIVMHTLDSLTVDIKKEETDKLREEQEAHQKTQETLHSQQDRNQEILSNIYWECHRNAKGWAMFISGTFMFILVAGSLAGLGFRSTVPGIGRFLIVCYTALVLLSLANLIFGTNLIRLHTRLQNRCLTWLLKRRAKTIGVDLSAFDRD